LDGEPPVTRFTSIIPYYNLFAMGVRVQVTSHRTAALATVYGNLVRLRLEHTLTIHGFLSANLRDEFA
jgi:hypothetical protein